MRFVYDDQHFTPGRMLGVDFDAWAEASAIWVIAEQPDWSLVAERLWDFEDTKPLTVPDDRVAELVAHHLVDVELAPLLSSHGGSITVESATCSQVCVHLSGHCHGCPAAALTVDGRILAGLRTRIGGDITVQAV